MRFLLALWLALLTSGCYSLSLNARSYPKPISMSAHAGRPATVLRHFRREAVTWYAVGVSPFFTLPGIGNPWISADRLVLSLCHEELARSGDAIVNLRVTQAHSVASLAFATLPGAAISLIPGLSPLIGGAIAALAQPIGVVVEGDVVQFNGKR